MRPVAWRDVWVGAITTAVLFTIGKSLIGLYLGRREHRLPLRGRRLAGGHDRLGVLRVDDRLLRRPAHLCPLPAQAEQWRGSAMNAPIVALISFGLIFGSAMIGMLVRRFLPEHHLRDDSKDTVKLGAGLIATLAALVLGLLVGSAKSSFDSVNAGLTHAGPLAPHRAAAGGAARWRCSSSSSCGWPCSTEASVCSLPQCHGHPRAVRVRALRLRRPLPHRGHE